ncbi:hypothetical protein GA0074692_6521 [Micromonospora pallida]|uniref:Uncharacterized protein n=1 Tax=Micromonospora pallida TaxID=145854 RepID=A0A1C6TJW4_9ACTN|nr:DUF6220 domain-containing protein [Micromonospora pallida]SCL41835.1 hypothetical protein GA0074692_6521 [Micromonospora pallida]
MRKAFTGLAALLMFVVVVQFFLAASGAINSAPTDEAFGPHRGLGFVTILLALVLTVVAAVVRMPGRLIGLSGLVVGLGILQPVIAIIAKALGESGAGQLVFGLHGVNGLAIMGVVLMIIRRSQALTAAPTTPAGTAAASPAAGSAAGPARSAS